MDFNLSDNPESTTFWRLVNLTAPYITGRACRVKRQEPTTIAYGETSVGLDGVPVVTISRRLRGDDLMGILLHELAHVKLHAKHMQRSDTEHEPPGSDPEFMPRQDWERDADAQTLVWVRYGAAHRDPYLPKDVAMLIALAEQNQNQNT